MSKKLLRWFASQLRYDIDIATIDFDAEVDKTLTFDENKSLLGKKFGHLFKSKDAPVSTEQLVSEELKQQIAFLNAFIESRANVPPEITQKLYTELEAFCPHMLRATLSTIIAINQNMHVINVGTAGMGKSRCTIDVLNMLGIPFRLIAGHVTAKGFFEILRNNKIIVLDESSTILANREILELLLSALLNHPIVWLTSKERLEHEFTGTIIFNSNYIADTRIFDAVRDRVIYNEIILTQQQLREKAETLETYKPDLEIWAYLKNQMHFRGKSDDIILNVVRESLEKIELTSIRTPLRLKQISIALRSILGDTEKLKLFLFDDPIGIIYYSNLKPTKKVEAIMELKGCSIATAWRIYKNYH